MTKIISTDAEINSIRLKEQSSAPATPASGYGQLYEKNDGKPYFKNDAGLENSLVGDDVIDWSNSGTVVGWSSYATREVFVEKQTSDWVICNFYIDGTSNSTGTSFTLPYTAKSVPSGGPSNYQSLIRIGDNGSAAAIGVASINASTSTIICYASIGGANWTASNQKYIIGQIWYWT